MCLLMFLQANTPLRVEPQIPTTHFFFTSKDKCNFKCIQSIFLQQCLKKKKKKTFSCSAHSFPVLVHSHCSHVLLATAGSFFLFLWKIFSKSSQYTTCSAADSRQTQLAAGEQRLMFPSRVAGDQKQLKESQH